MATRTQGSHIITDLPAEAAKAISSNLRAQIMIQAQTMAGQERPDSREQSLHRMQIWNQQAAMIAQKAWHEAPDSVVQIRLNARCWNEALSALETADLRRSITAAVLLDEAIAALKDAILRRDGLKDTDGTITLPDMP